MCVSVVQSAIILKSDMRAATAWSCSGRICEYRVHPSTVSESETSKRVCERKTKRPVEAEADVEAEVEVEVDGGQGGE